MTTASITGKATLKVSGHGRTPASFRVVFSTEDQALSFIAARPGHYFDEVENADYPGVSSIPATWSRLIEAVYPTCEHGMSKDNCYGPDHFMSADQERAMDWGYADAPSGF